MNQRSTNSVTTRVASPLRSYTDGQPIVEASGSTVRPILPIREGRLDPVNLRALRDARDRALAEGLRDPLCGPGDEPPPGRIVISGRPPVLVLVRASGNDAPPGRIDCWSASARALAERLRNLFRREAGPRLATDPPPPPPTGPAPHAIFASVGRSEWGPPGRVALDLRTGDYWITPAPPPLHAYSPLDLTVRKGRLEPRVLGLVRAAEARARGQSMADKPCLARPHSSGDRDDAPYLLLTDRTGTIGAPYPAECRARAATGLSDLLERLFGSAARPWG